MPENSAESVLFDLETAVWLLNYSETREQLVSMASSASANIAKGGRLWMSVA
ncbi:MAG: hypothetical protein P8R42_10235 [Candidatus Binatia bacterium]|nr:hypothetical protein [Candidatus Binatia bacterium]